MKKEIWLHEWDEDFLDECIGREWSCYDENSSLETQGKFGDLLSSRLGRDYIHGSLSQLPITWSDIRPG